MYKYECYTVTFAHDGTPLVWIRIKIWLKKPSSLWVQSKWGSINCALIIFIRFWRSWEANMCRLHVKCFITEKDTHFGVNWCDENSLKNSEYSWMFSPLCNHIMCSHSVLVSIQALLIISMANSSHIFVSLSCGFGISSPSLLFLLLLFL